jgi:hypothetical protein
MLPSATLPPAAAGVARPCVAALAAPTGTRLARSRLADILCQTVRDGCTAQACAEGERPPRLPLDGRAEGS